MLSYASDTQLEQVFFFSKINVHKPRSSWVKFQLPFCLKVEYE